MPVSVVDVRIMRMGVRHRLVPVPMSVRRWVGHWWVGMRVGVLMMFVVYVPMVVLHRFVLMLVLVPLGEM